MDRAKSLTSGDPKSPAAPVAHPSLQDHVLQQSIARRQVRAFRWVARPEPPEGPLVSCDQQYAVPSRSQVSIWIERPSSGTPGLRLEASRSALTGVAWSACSASSTQMNPNPCWPSSPVNDGVNKGRIRGRLIKDHEWKPLRQHAMEVSLRPSMNATI